MNNPWNDELRAYLLRWLMEFGDDWVSYEARTSNKWWMLRPRVAGLAIPYNTDQFRDFGQLKVFESKRDGKDVEDLYVRLNERALAFLKGETDEQN